MRRDAALVALCCLVCVISKTTRTTASSVVKLRKLNILYRPDKSVKLISILIPALTCSYYLPLPGFTYNISIYYYIVGYTLEVVHETVIQSVSNGIFHIFNDRRRFIY